MNQQKSLIRIAELLSRFSIETNILNANAQLDINIVAEDVLIPILNIVYKCSLTNAKYSESDIKFPALDLLDRNCRVGFQITSTATISKVRKTIEGIIKHDFQTQFDEFYIYIITQKQNGYNKNILKNATQGFFSFTDKNILDGSDLYLKIASLAYKEILEIEQLLERQFSDIIRRETLIQSEIGKIIEQAKIKYNEKFLMAEIEGAYNARQAWLDKKIFFEKLLPTVSDINQQFTLYTQIEDINKKIEQYNNQISRQLENINKV